MFVMDTQATDGQNVFAMLIGRNQNKDMFSSCYDQRDSRTFGKYDTYWLNIQLGNTQCSTPIVNLCQHLANTL